MDVEIHRITGDVVHMASLLEAFAFAEKNSSAFKIIVFDEGVYSRITFERDYKSSRMVDGVQITSWNYSVNSNQHPNQGVLNV